MTQKGGDSYFTDSEQVVDAVVVTEDLTVPETTVPTVPTTVEPTGTTTVEPTGTTTVEPTEKTDATSKTDVPDEKPEDVPGTGATVAIYSVLATLAMAAAAVVVLRKKVNG